MRRALVTWSRVVHPGTGQFRSSSFGSSLFEKAQLKFTDEEWATVRKLLNAGVAEDNAIRSVFEEKHAAAMPVKGLASARFTGAGAKSADERTVIERYRGVVQNARHQLLSECWAFPETEVPVRTCLDCSEEEVESAMLYLASDTDESVRRWKTYCTLEPELALLDEDDEFQEAYAHVYELRHQLASDGGPDPAVFCPVEWQLAEQKLRNHPKQRRYLAHVVSFARRSASEKKRLAQLMAAKTAKDPAERRRLLLGT
ncbi:hypothetical protein DIPPA_00471 [Diplonema papillatum]|nr:hypothetical protein DIPPA_00471 [Diplonema papillatum]KAJ9460157.1 hypothetical protein DIPPA_00471 [Diplonema papillatum]